MTIRTKLLVFFPLLMLLTNAIALFLFANANAAQSSYGAQMERVLSYNLTVQAAETYVQAAYRYMLDPSDANERAAADAERALRERRERIAAASGGLADAAVRIGWARQLDTLAAQAAETAKASEAGRRAEALASYEAAERTAAYVREDGQRLVEMELRGYVPLYEAMSREIAKLNRYGALVFCVNTALSVALALWISRSVTVPVSRLVRMASDVSQGRFAPLPASAAAAPDELGVLSEAFANMQRGVRELMEREKADLERDRLLKDLELQALQSQIHPHFLFNTLNVISKLSLIEGAERTSDLIVSLSKMLRYNLRNLDEPVALRDEVAHVREYIAIQRARFRENVSFELDVDEAALDRPIPCLTLQPLVENAFHHGIGDNERGAAVTLRIRPVGDEIWITVRDNGAGMSEDVRRSLLRLEPPEGRENRESTGLGVRNVLKRLQLFTGREDIVAIESEPGRGTAITLKLPGG